MKFILVFLMIALSAFNLFAAFDAYATLYKSKITLTNGNKVTGYYYHFNYDTIPKYSYTNKEFHEFLIHVGKDKGDSIEIYAKLQNIRIPSVHDFDSNRFSAVTKEDLFKIAIKDIESAEFISSCKCDECRIYCTIIKELNQTEINRLKLGKAKFLYSIDEPGLAEDAEAGYIHFAFGNERIISEAEFQRLVSSLYIRKEDCYKLDIPNYHKLKEELRGSGIILITLYETDYFTSNDL